MRGNRIRRMARLLVLSALLFAFDILVFEFSPVASSAGGLVSHDPIRIMDSSGFTVENGVVGGSGTSTDPYIIEGWDIDGGESNCININNTDRYFVIRNVWVHNGNFGIYLHNVTNGAIHNCTTSGNNYGVSFFLTKRSRIEATKSTGNHYGIMLGDSFDNTFISNDLSSNRLGVYSSGIWLYRSSNNTIMDNNFSANEYAGIYLMVSSNNTVINNRVHDSEDGIFMCVSNNNTVAMNEIYGNWDGIWVAASNNNLLYNNVTLNTYGVRIGDFSPTTYGNNLIGNLVKRNYRGGIGIGWSDNNTIFNNTLTENALEGVGNWCFEIRGSNNNISRNLISNNRLALILANSNTRNNILYRNEFIDNDVQAEDEGTNYWYYNGDGNYWSDYDGRDANWDGVGDTPYFVGNGRDKYPLMYTKVIINLVSMSDNRCDVGSTQTVSFHAEWFHNFSGIKGGTIYINGTECVTNSEGWANLNITYDHVGKTVWTITGVRCLHHWRTITEFNYIVPKPQIIWDRAKITEKNASSTSLNVTQSTTLWLKATYEYDGAEFNGTMGTVFINGTAMVWSPADKRWEHNLTFREAGRRTFAVSGVIDRQYGLETVNDPVETFSIIWKYPEVYVNGTLYQMPVDTNSTISDFIYNPITRRLNVTVSGLQGTTGTLNLTTAKDLVPEGYSFEVYLDSTPHPFVVTENATCYFIYLTYTHGVRHIVINVVDITPPVLSITQPMQDETIRSSIVTVVWNSSDIGSGIDHYEVRLDDGPWINVETYSTHPFTAVPDGNHIIRVKSFDKTGNSKENQIGFTVNTSIISGPGWVDDATVFGVAACTAIGGLIIVLKKRDTAPSL